MGNAVIVHLVTSDDASFAGAVGVGSLSTSGTCPRSIEFLDRAALRPQESVRRTVRVDDGADDGAVVGYGRCGCALEGVCTCPRSVEGRDRAGRIANERMECVV